MLNGIDPQHLDSQWIAQWNSTCFIRSNPPFESVVNLYFLELCILLYDKWFLIRKKQVEVHCFESQSCLFSRMFLSVDAFFIDSQITATPDFIGSKRSGFDEAVQPYIFDKGNNLE
jgi:hypothetical protein